MEQVNVYRHTPSVDEDGNPTGGALTQVGVLSALVAPQDATEQIQERGSVIPVLYKIYVRSTEPINVTEADMLQVRGSLHPVVNQPQTWIDSRGRIIGHVISVGSKE